MNRFLTLLQVAPYIHNKITKPNSTLFVLVFKVNFSDIMLTYPVVPSLTYNFMGKQHPTGVRVCLHQSQPGASSPQQRPVQSFTALHRKTQLKYYAPNFFNKVSETT